MNSTGLIIRLTKQAMVFRNKQFRRIHSFRAKLHTKRQKETTKIDSWDLPIVVVTCASCKYPNVIGNGRNCSKLRNPASVVADAYSSIKDKYGNSMSKSICLGTAPSPSLKNYFGYSRQTGNIAGRCAEPHAAHNLAGKLSKKGFVLKLNDIVFSLAINVSTSSVKPYCATCKIVFPQLR